MGRLFEAFREAVYRHQPLDASVVLIEPGDSTSGYPSDTVFVCTSVPKKVYPPDG